MKVDPSSVVVLRLKATNSPGERLSRLLLDWNRKNGIVNDFQIRGEFVGYPSHVQTSGRSSPTVRIVSGSEVIESSRASVRPDLTTLRNDSCGKIRRIKTDVGSMSHTPREIGYHFSKTIHGIPSQQVVFHRRNRSMLKLEGFCLAKLPSFSTAPIT